MVDGDNGEGSSRNPPPPPLVAGFTPEQWATIINLIRTSAVTTPTAIPQSQREWKAEEVGFFDSSLDDVNDAPIVTVDRHSCYRDIYSYVDRLKDLAKQRSPDKLRTILPECFRGDTQIWYSIELGEMEKDLLRSVPLEKWYEALIKRFKTRTPRALELLQTERYTFVDARNKKHPRAYV